MKDSCTDRRKGVTLGVLFRCRWNDGHKNLFTSQLNLLSFLPHTDGCVCDPGFQGPDCALPCPVGHYGNHCGGICRCHNNAYCRPQDGICVCRPGYHGDTCQERKYYTYFVPSIRMHCQKLSTFLHTRQYLILNLRTFGASLFHLKILPFSGCPHNRYGQDCDQMCFCDESCTCHHVTGECNVTLKHTDLWDGKPHLYLVHLYCRELDRWGLQFPCPTRQTNHTGKVQNRKN